MGKSFNVPHLPMILPQSRFAHKAFSGKPVSVHNLYTFLCAFPQQKTYFSGSKICSSSNLLKIV